MANATISAWIEYSNASYPTSITNLSVAVGQVTLDQDVHSDALLANGAYSDSFDATPRELTVRDYYAGFDYLYSAGNMVSAYSSLVALIYANGLQRGHWIYSLDIDGTRIIGDEADGADD